MDDRHNYCDVCGQPITGVEIWDREDGDPIGPNDEIDTPPGLIDPAPFGDGCCHQRCLENLITLDAGAGI